VKKLAPDYAGQFEAVLKQPAISDTLFSEYLKTKEPSDLYRVLNDSFFWLPGDYHITLTVSSSDSRQFAKSWAFTLGAKDTERLRLNLIVLLQELCGLRATYHFAYPQYTPG
jgi:hypothetical protein